MKHKLATATITAAQKLPIGILGGTFDPIHYGHLRAAVELYQSLPLQQLRFIPCQTPVHKVDALAAPQHRLAMLKLALQPLPFAIIDERELQRSSPSYMVETLFSLRQAFVQQPLCLIIGNDAFAHFKTWHRWQDILNLAHLLVLKRPGYDKQPLGNAASLLTNHQTQDWQTLLRQPSGAIWVQAIEGLAISSTQIRQLLQQHKSPQFLLPDSVLTYIENHQLYQCKSTF